MRALRALLALVEVEIEAGSGKLSERTLDVTKIGRGQESSATGGRSIDRDMEREGNRLIVGHQLAHSGAKLITDRAKQVQTRGEDPNSPWMRQMEDEIMEMGVTTSPVNQQTRRSPTAGSPRAGYHPKQSSSGSPERDNIYQ